MDQVPADNQGSSNNQKPIWCCLMHKLPIYGTEENRAPTDPKKLFQWICDQNFPQLEDETPPMSFYEVLETKDNAVRCSQCEKLLMNLNAETLQLTIGTQTQILQLIQAQTQTETQKKHILTQIANATTGSQTDQASAPSMLEDSWSHRLRSFWSVVKTVLLCISVLNGFYLLCIGTYRLSIWSRCLLCIETPPPPSTAISTPSATTWVPSFMWTQLCKLARKLHII